MITSSEAKVKEVIDFESEELKDYGDFDFHDFNLSALLISRKYGTIQLGETSIAERGNTYGQTGYYFNRPRVRQWWTRNCQGDCRPHESAVLQSRNPEQHCEGDERRPEDISGV